MEFTVLFHPNVPLPFPLLLGGIGDTVMTEGVTLP